MINFVISCVCSSGSFHPYQVFDGLEVGPSESDTGKVLQSLSETQNQQEVKYVFRWLTEYDWIDLNWLE